MYSAMYSAMYKEWITNELVDKVHNPKSKSEAQAEIKHHRQDDAKKGLQVFSERLKDLLAERKISESDLAQIINVSQPTLSNATNYDTYVNPHTKGISILFLIQICEYFDVSMDYMTGRTMERKPHDFKSKEEIENSKSKYEKNLNRSCERLKWLSFIEDFPEPTHQSVYHIRYWGGLVYLTDVEYLIALMWRWYKVVYANIPEKEKERRNKEFPNLQMNDCQSFVDGYLSTITDNNRKETIKLFEELLFVDVNKTDSVDFY